MAKVLQKIRSPRFRLLASLLVMLAILCNGIGLAQAHSHSMPVEKDCCAEMMANKMSPDTPCSQPGDNCDDQCMARCMNANGILFSIPLAISANSLVTRVLSQPNVPEHAPATFGPGLRPPISA